MLKYSMLIQWSEEDEGFIALVPEFPDLSGFGETPEEAANELQVAIEAAVEVLEEEGARVPTPRLLSTYSGQLRLRLPQTLHQALALRADAEGVSLNSLILALLAEAVGRGMGELEQQRATERVGTQHASQLLGAWSTDVSASRVKGAWSIYKDVCNLTIAKGHSASQQRWVVAGEPVRGAREDWSEYMRTMQMQTGYQETNVVLPEGAEPC